MPKIKVACAWCKKSLLRWPSNLKGTKFGPFCNRDCIGLYRTKHLVGEYAANFKRGFKRDRKYILVLASWHPYRRGSHVYLHRLLAEASLGRFLKENEIVHHIDHNPDNNHWDNLEVMTQSAHASLHFSKGSKHGHHISKT